MRFERIEITDFRGIGHIELAFEETHPIVFIGVNGAGKSSILDALAYGLYDVVCTFQGEPVPEPHFKLTADDIRHGKDHAEFAWHATIGDRRVPWSHRFSRRNTLTPLPALSQDWCLETQHLRAAINELGDRLPLAARYPTNRGVPSAPVDTHAVDSAPPISAYDNAIGSTSAEFAGFFEWLRFREDYENEYRVNDSVYRDRQLEAVRTAITEFVPDYLNLRVRRNPPRLTLDKSAFGTSAELSFLQLSDGERLAITMIGDIARRLAIANPESPEPLAEPGIAIIDEIELHLHPAWQRIIMPRLVRIFPKCQFIVSTHSPQVLSEIEKAHVFLLEAAPAADSGIKCTKLDNLYGRDSNRILEDIMGVPDRPEPIKEALLELFRIIDRGDLKGARKKREEIGKLIYSDEPEFAAADVLLHRLEMRAK